MVRNPTISKIYSKKELHELIINSVRDAGWNISLLSNLEQSPLRLLLANGSKQEEIAVYIWNISHGGKTRSPDEYRIQLKGQSSLVIGNTFKTLLLGWYQQERVFAGFNAFKHKDFGKSPSIQVKKDILHEAVKHGIAFQSKTTAKGQDIVVTFQPNYIMDYVEDIYPQYHANGLINISDVEASVVEKPLDILIPDEELNKVPIERRTVLSTINKKVREERFQRYVRSMYKGKCAICSLQAKLTEAAHIIPVKDNGTDELTNGVLLCRNHHKAFDMGLLAINSSYVIVLNQNYEKYLIESHQDTKLKEFIANSRIGQIIYLPEDKRFYPKKEYLNTNCKLKGV